MKVLAYGEIMLRMEVPDHKLIQQEDTFRYLFTGTGVNVLAGLNKFGHDTEILSALPDNNLGKAAISHLNKLGISSKATVLFGAHMGAYILEKGYGLRPSEVTYLDREKSSFNIHTLDNDYLKSILRDVDIVHVCGIALSTSELANVNLKQIVELAKSMDIKVIFDFNFRAKANEDYSLREDYKAILKQSDIVFGSRRDIVELLGHDDEQDFQTLCSKFSTTYDIEVFAGTIRNDEGYQGFIFRDSNLSKSKIYNNIETFDRIGTGDAYASAIIDGYIKSYEPSKTVERATAYGVLAHTTYGDSPVASVELIEDIISGNYQSIKR